MIAHYAAQGIMLPRSHSGLAESLSNYVVADLDGQVLGSGGLEQYSSSTAEIFGLATSPNKPVRGTGSAIVEALIEKARSVNIAHVFALTLAPAFFQKMGFRTVQHTHLPMKVWKDCIACPSTAIAAKSQWCSILIRNRRCRRPEEAWNRDRNRHN